MKKVTKAVIPAAGLGTRVLPATKAMPKGMLPIVDKPAIQYLVEEAVRSGITDILIILGRNQSIIEDHFDRSPELEEKLAKPGKEKMLEECLGIANLANILFVRQKETLGLGHAVNTAKAFTGDDPFVVIYGDDVIWGEDPVCAQLIRAYEEFGRPVAGVSAVPWEDVSRYCSLKTTPIHDNSGPCVADPGDLRDPCPHQARCRRRDPADRCHGRVRPHPRRHDCCGVYRQALRYG